MLAVMTTILSVVIAVPAGVLAAWRAGSLLDRWLMAGSVLGFSVPVFVVGYLLVQSSPSGSLVSGPGLQALASGIWECLRSLTLPSLALAFLFAALLARITRATMIEVLAEDYIRTARAKGARSPRVLGVHALKNVGVPVVTVIGRASRIARRRCHHGIRLQHPGHGAAHRRRHHLAGLPRGAGRAARLFLSP